MDAKAFEEHQKTKCFPLMLKPMDITIRTTVPVNVLAHLLERMGIQVLQASQDYPDTVYNEPVFEQPPPSPISGNGFANFREKYKNELYSADHNEEGDKNIEEYENSLQIEEVASSTFEKKKKKVNYTEHTMSKDYLKYLSDLNKLSEHGNDDLEKVFNKYYKISKFDCSTGASCFNLVNLKTIDKLSVNDLKVALSYLNKLYPRIYDSDNTVKSYFSAIRTVLKKKYGLETKQYLLSQDLMKQSVEIKQKLETQYKLKTKDKNRNKIVFYLEDVYDKIDEALASDNLFDQLAGLMLVSGARTKELIYDNTYKVHPKAKGYIIIGDIGKRREGQENKFDTLERPLLKITPETFIKRVKKLRKDMAKEYDILNDKEQLHQDISRNLKSSVVKLFKRDDFNPRWLRKIYGNSAYLLFVKDKNTFDRSTYLSDILGHKESDVSTAASYTVINVVKRPVSNITQKMKTDDSSYEVNLNTEVLQNQINELKREIKTVSVPEVQKKVKDTKKFIGSREQKEEHVKKVYKQMVKQKEKISVRRVMAKSTISQRIVVEVLKDIPGYKPGEMN